MVPWACYPSGMRTDRVADYICKFASFLFPKGTNPVAHMSLLSWSTSRTSGRHCSAGPPSLASQQVGFGRVAPDARSGGEKCLCSRGHAWRAWDGCRMAAEKTKRRREDARARGRKATTGARSATRRSTRSQPGCVQGSPQSVRGAPALRLPARHALPQQASLRGWTSPPAPRPVHQSSQFILRTLAHSERPPNAAFFFPVALQ